MKKYLTYILLSFPTMLWAQPRFTPKQEIIKVGEVAFQQPKQVNILFTNTGSEALLLTEVKPSCGCLMVSYPHESIPPGQQGQIQIVFDALMLGSFYKDVEIHASDSPEPHYVYLDGRVVTEVQDYSAEFPIDLGNVLLETNYLEFQQVYKGENPVVELKLHNLEHSPFRPELMHLPPYLSAEAKDIPAGQSGTIRITLLSDKLPLLGLNQTSVYLARYLGDKVSETNEIVISSILLPDFSHLTPEQVAQAPNLYVSDHLLELGSLGQKSSKSGTVVLKNTGLSDLHFRQVQVLNRGISVKLRNRVLKPGKSTKLRITANARYLRKAKNSPRVLLITDDPNHPIAQIHVDVKP